MKRLLPCGLVTLLALLVPEVSPAQAAPETSPETSRQQVEQCVAQHDSARQLRLGEQWLEARAAMHACADERCPLAIVADCRDWLDELNRIMPTLLLVIEQSDPSRDWSTLRVELDGKIILLPDPPAPIEMLPGLHTLRVEVRGHSPIERTITLQKSEKNHLEQIHFAEPRPMLLTAPRTASPLARPVPLSTYLLSAGALAAFVGSAGLLVSALHERADAWSNCAPNCTPDVRRSIERRLVLADVSGGVGITLAGMALYTFLTRPVVGTTGALVPALALGPNGGTLSWQGRF